MASSPLPNHLLAHRKRLALTQDEMAYLLGTQEGSNVCRGERFTRMPSLEDALAYEAIHGKPVRELFAGLYENIAQGVAARATTLAARDGDKSGRRAEHRRKMLAAIAARRSNTIQTS